MTRRLRVTAVTALLGSIGVIGLAGCGAAGQPVPDAAGAVAVEVASAMGADGQALAAMGFDVEDIAAEATASPDAAASPEAAASAVEAKPSSSVPTGARQGERAADPRQRARARVLLRRNTLHGEVVVQGKDGTKTVAVQRGTVTAIDGTSMTVKSTDGFTLTWTFGPDLRVVQRRATVQPSEVKVGTQLGVSGAKDGDNGVARLVVIPRLK
ncbi:hypothetical protein AB0J90_15555 [Micromonospora sp. NPDC049523]|uniref:hypothetical protein n=1 Tax=Micromonospora sp. NPDC049523 TaxID=3155921 RepID=UPI00343E996F